MSEGLAEHCASQTNTKTQTKGVSQMIAKNTETVATKKTDRTGLLKKSLPATEREFLTVREVAAELDVGPGVIYKMISAGEIPVVKVHGSIRIPRRVLEAMAENAGAEVWQGRGTE
jgi:excisionase family DNA binding protein